jgi:hypothetical protein
MHVLVHAPLLVVDIRWINGVNMAVPLSLPASLSHNSRVGVVVEVRET